MDHATAPTVVRPYLGQILVSAGKEYEVQAMAAFEGDVSVQIIDDLGYPAWNTAWLFDIVDPAVPADWICSTFHDDPRLILGPAFIASSQDAYASMVQLEPEQVDKFWKRVEHHRSGHDMDHLKMPSDQTNRCRVCGLLVESPPWGTDGRTPLFEYCPCCGVEWGYADATPEGARRFREKWLQRGGEWDQPDQRPPDWVREEQMAHIPREFR